MTGSQGGKGESRVGVEVSTPFREEGAPLSDQATLHLGAGPRGAHPVTRHSCYCSGSCSRSMSSMPLICRERASRSPGGSLPPRPAATNHSLPTSLQSSPLKLQLLIPSFPFFLFFGFWCRHGGSQYTAEAGRGGGSRASREARRVRDLPRCGTLCARSWSLSLGTACQGRAATSKAAGSGAAGWGAWPPPGGCLPGA